MSSDRRILRYGHIVRLHSDSHHQQGLIVSKGFTQRSVYYQTYNLLETVINYRESLFQILPKGSFEIHDEFLKSSHSKDKELFAHRMNTESEQYVSLIKQKHDEEILIGHEIILKHIDSNSYLTGSYECSDFSTDAFKVQLSNLLSSDTMFKIQPFNTYQKNGQMIYYDEPFILLNSKQRFYLDFVGDKQVTLDRFKGTEDNIRSPNLDCKRFETIITHNGKSTWRFRFHEGNQKPHKLLIKPYDLVQLQHTSNGSYLSVKSIISDEQELKSLNVILKEVPENSQLPLEAVWELQPIVQNDTKFRGKKKLNTQIFGAHSSVISPRHNLQLTDINHIQSHHDEMLISSQNKLDNSRQLVFRHFITGKTLAVMQNEDYNLIPELSLNPQIPEQPFDIVFSKPGENELVQNCYINICFNGHPLQYIDQKSQYDQTEERKSSSQDHFSEKSTKYLAFQDTYIQDAFRISSIPEILKEELLFVISGQEDLYLFVRILQDYDQEDILQELNQKILNGVINVLKQLLAFVQSLKEGDDSEKLDGQPVQSRQKCFKDLLMIEMLMQILVNSSKRELLQQKKKEWKIEREKVGQIFRLSYLLLKILTKNNKDIKMHVSQFLQVFIQQGMIIDEPTVQASLTELLDDNYHAISNYVDEKLIKNVIDILQLYPPHEKYLKILSSICICPQKAVVKNQNLVLEHFFKQIPNKLQHFSFKFKKSANRVLIHCFIAGEVPGWRNLNQFYQDSKSTDDKQSWTYFLAFINLLSDVCGFRNKNAQEFVYGLLSLEMLCSLIEDEAAIETESLECFLKLAHYCYVDNSIYQPIRLMSRTMEWDQIQNKNEMNEIPRTWVDKRFLPENTDLRRIMDFITKFIQIFDYFDSKKKVKNQTLLRVLRILKTTIELGFWKTVADLKIILNQLIRICSCSADFNNYQEEEQVNEDQLETEQVSSKQQLLEGNELRMHYKKVKQKLTRKTPENQLIMQNKIKACEIIDIILFMEVNIRVVKMTQALKSLIEESDSEPESQLTIPTNVKPLNVFQQMVQRIVKILKLEKYPIITNRKSIGFLNLQPVESRKPKDMFDPQVWCKIITRISKERDLFDTLDANIQLELVFAEISLFQDPQMMEYALSLLNKIYGQRRLTFMNFSKVIIISDKQTLTKTLSQQSRIIREKLKQLVDISQLTPLQIWNPIPDVRERGLIQDIHFLCCSLKKSYITNEGSYPDIDIDQLNPEDSLRCVINEKEEYDRVHQTLFKAQDMHESIINFINREKIDDKNPLHLKLLDICYEFLTLLIWNNPIIKIELGVDLTRVYQHLKYNIVAIDFLRELFTSNKDLLYNTNEIQTLLTTIIGEMERLPQTSPYKVKLLDALRVLQYDNSKIIKANQLMTLSQLQENKYSNVMFILTGQKKDSLKLEKELELSSQILKSNMWNDASFKQLIKRYNLQYEQLGSVLCIDPELQYIATFFQMFSLLVEDNNKNNAEKCRQMHPYKQLISILIESPNCWPLQHHVRAYINRLYYRSTKFENITYILIEYDLKCIAYQLELIIKIKENNKSYYNVKLANPTRFCFLFTYVYSTLHEILLSLNLILVSEQFLLDLEDSLDQHAAEKDLTLHNSLVQIACHLKHIERLWFKSSYISNFCIQMTNLLQCIFETFSIQILHGIALQITKKKFEEVSHDEQGKQEIISYLINYSQHKLSEEEKRATRIQMSLKKAFHHKKVKQLHVDIETQKENSELNLKHSTLIKTLQDSSEFAAYQEEEFNQLCNKLIMLNDLSQKVYRVSNIIPVKDFIENIIQLNLENPNCLSDNLKIFFLKILVRMISEKNANLNQTENKPIDEWEPEFWSESKKSIEDEQNFLEECGAASLIFSMFKDTSLEEKWTLCSQLIIFTNAFLLGGNTRCQNSILQKLVADQSNQMLVRIQQLVRTFSKYICHNLKSKKTKRADHSFSKNSVVNVYYVDNLQYYSEQQETLKRVIASTTESQKNVQQKQTSLQALWRTFRMLQLMCENNNVNFKRFLLQQNDKEGFPRLNSLNLIEYATKELRQFLKILNKTIIKVPIQIIDFINEVIQLPCIESQNALCKSTFLEDVCFVSQFFQKRQNLKARGFDDMTSLHEFFSKVIQSIMQILEGNNKVNYESLEAKLDSSLLTEFIRQTTTMHEITTDTNLEKIMRSNQPQFPQELEQVMNVAIIQQKIQAMNPDSRWVLHLKEEIEADPAISKVFQFCSLNLLKIEIFYEGEQQMVFFPAHPVFRFLSDETKDKIMFNVHRETQRIKLIELLAENDRISQEIEYNYKLNQQVIPITHKTITKLVNLAQSLSFIINFLMIVFYGVVIENQQSRLETEYYEDIIMQTLGLVQLFISLIIYIFYLISRAPLELKLVELKEKQQEKYRIMKLIKFLWQQAGNVYQIIKGDDFLQYTFYLIISLAGAISNSYYFSLHLFYIFSRLSLLQSVFQAISHNATQLVMVAMLGVLFQYVFSIVGFNNYVDDIYQSEQPEEACHSLLSCMITLMTSGVIGTSMSKWDPLKFLYDTVYFVFFGLLFTNIIAGIMTDTFAGKRYNKIKALRDERESIEDDKKNNCYICGIDRSTLEKHQEDFYEHITSKHFLWNYIFYLYCLQKKDSTEYTGLEYWIIDKFNKDNITWFPIVGAENEIDLESKIGEINNKLDKVLEQFRIQTQEQQDSN